MDENLYRLFFILLSSVLINSPLTENDFFSNVAGRESNWGVILNLLLVIKIYKYYDNKIHSMV